MWVGDNQGCMKELTCLSFLGTALYVQWLKAANVSSQNMIPRDQAFSIAAGPTAVPKEACASWFPNVSARRVVAVACGGQHVLALFAGEHQPSPPSLKHVLICLNDKNQVIKLSRQDLKPHASKWPLFEMVGVDSTREYPAICTYTYDHRALQRNCRVI